MENKNKLDQLSRPPLEGSISRSKVVENEKFRHISYNFIEIGD